jgi:hypothetical protein
MKHALRTLPGHIDANVGASCVVACAAAIMFGANAVFALSPRPSQSMRPGVVATK